MNNKIARTLLTVGLTFIFSAYLCKATILYTIASDIERQEQLKQKGITSPLNEEITAKKVYMYKYIKDNTIIP